MGPGKRNGDRPGEVGCPGELVLTSETLEQQLGLVDVRAVRLRLAAIRSGLPAGPGFADGTSIHRRQPSSCWSKRATLPGEGGGTTVPLLESHLQAPDLHSQIVVPLLKPLQLASCTRVQSEVLPDELAKALSPVPRSTYLHALAHDQVCDTAMERRLRRRGDANASRVVICSIWPPIGLFAGLGGSGGFRHDEQWMLDHEAVFSVGAESDYNNKVIIGGFISHHYSLIN